MKRIIRFVLMLSILASLLPFNMFEAKAKNAYYTHKNDMFIKSVINAKTESEETITVTYHANGGAFSDESTVKVIERKKGDNFVSADVSRSPENKMFVGWAFDKNTKPTEYEKILTGIPINESIDVYAIYSDTYIFDANGGKCTGMYCSLQERERVSIPVYKIS